MCLEELAVRLINIICSSSIIIHLLSQHIRQVCETIRVSVFVLTSNVDAPQTMKNDGSGVGQDPAQLKDTYVLQNEPEDSSYIIGHSPGPYVQEHSRSLYARLGARIAFFGLDARTERTRHQVNYPDTYQLIHDRLQKELAAAAATPNRIQHLVVLLGIPIAYPVSFIPIFALLIH
jgi:hypothetical protein